MVVCLYNYIPDVDIVCAYLLYACGHPHCLISRDIACICAYYHNPCLI